MEVSLGIAAGMGWGIALGLAVALAVALSQRTRTARPPEGGAQTGEVVHPGFAGFGSRS